MGFQCDSEAEFFPKRIGLSIESPRSSTGILTFYPHNNFFQISIIFPPFWSEEIEIQCRSNFPKISQQAEEPGLEFLKCGLQNCVVHQSLRNRLIVK